METTRKDGRGSAQLRPVTITNRFQANPEGSVLYRCGGTLVLVAASVEEQVPPWMKGQGRGWVTAEYAMHPRANPERQKRDGRRGSIDGRTAEIQRLIARSLRAAVRLEKIGERMITVDCDVLDADGGTRTASITGAWVALHDCIAWMKARGLVKDGVVRDHVAAVSCGVCKNVAVLDLDYAEDSEAQTDANFVMTGSGTIIEIQGTAEREPFTEEQFLALLALARKGIGKLVDLQKLAVT